MQSLNKRGNLVVGFIIGAVFATTAIFFSTHHIVIDKKSCHYQSDIEKTVCSFHYERNN